MFTLTDIRDIAIQIERNGEAAYRHAAEKISNVELAQMLTWMADEELRHIRWFEALKTDHIETRVNQEVEQMGRELLQEMMSQQTFSLSREQLENPESSNDILAQSLIFEQDTIVFYEMLGSFIDKPEVRDQLDAVIEEERRHVAQIERMQRGFAKIQPS